MVKNRCFWFPALKGHFRYICIHIISLWDCFCVGYIIIENGCLQYISGYSAIRYLRVGTKRQLSEELSFWAFHIDHILNDTDMFGV